MPIFTNAIYDDKEKELCHRSNLRRGCRTSKAAQANSLSPRTKAESIHLFVSSDGYHNKVCEFSLQPGHFD